MTLKCGAAWADRTDRKGAETRASDPGQGGGWCDDGYVVLLRMDERGGASLYLIHVEPIRFA